jgi:hypothetical protein
MSPPHTLKETTLYPVHTALYVMFMLSACALFSNMWVEVSVSGPRGVAKQLKDRQDGKSTSVSKVWIDGMLIRPDRSWPATVRGRYTRNLSALFPPPPPSEGLSSGSDPSLPICWVQLGVGRVFSWKLLSSTAVRFPLSSLAPLYSCAFRP